MCRGGIVVVAVLAASMVSAEGAYIVTPLSEGIGSRTVDLGESFDLDVVLTSDAADEHLSAVFRVAFSSPGLSYESYQWLSPYAN